MKYNARTKPPDKSNKLYYSDKNIFYRYGYGMPNCTCYAYGRYAEIFGVFLPCRGNAEDWLTEAKNKGEKVGNNPSLGAVAIWKCGKLKSGDDGAGHVAVVEEIKANGDIVCSNSAWGGTEFYMQTFSYKKGYAWKGKKYKYDFLGFIEPRITLTESEKPMTVTGSLYLRGLPSKKGCIRATMHKGDTFLYDGLFYFADGVKWLHGTFDNCIGYASAKYMT